MADTVTINLSMTLPEIGASDDTWGDKLNDNFDLLDALFATSGQGTVLVRDASDELTIPGISVAKAAGNARLFKLLSGSSKRWDLGADATAEGGSNAGSLFKINRYSDAAAFLGTPIAIARDTGCVTFETTPKVGGNNIWHAANDGTGSGLDADLLDGHEASYFAPVASPTLTGTTTCAVFHATGAATLDGKLSLTSTDSMAPPRGTTAQRNGTPSEGDLRYNTTLHVAEFWNGTAWIALGKAPTVTRLTSGTGATYNTPTGCVRLHVRMCGGGGGGGGSSNNGVSSGLSGGATSFGLWTAVGGGGGDPGNSGSPAGGAGGSGGTDGTGTLINRIAGGDGGGGWGSTGGTNIFGAVGGANPFGGAGAATRGFTGGAGKANTGAGGAGGASGNARGGCGGGAGEYVEFNVDAPSASYSYTVGSGGAGGTDGNAGGAGAVGVILVEEFYS